jgi:phosphoribosylformimino-5-aminoimidazole carboxamide ribotide isomerase
MLIPSIDLQGGRIVQLVQGETLALESHDLDAWIVRFRRFTKVQLIDLDAATGVGRNDKLVRHVVRALPCRVGGGIRSVDRATELVSAGARAVIVGSALFAEDGRVNHAFGQALADTIGVERVIAAVDSRGGHVVIHGWKTILPLAPDDAIAQLEPYCTEFLYTHVDTEGLMQGTDIAAIRRVAAATSKKLTAAGGITTQAEIDALDEIGVDAVVGMAVYTGRLSID